MIKCDICDAAISAGSPTCPSCGNNVSGASIIEPGTPANHSGDDSDNSRTAHTSTTGSRSASVSTSLSSIYMRSVGSSSISVAASNLPSPGLPTSRNAGRAADHAASPLRFWVVASSTSIRSTPETRSAIAEPKSRFRLMPKSAFARTTGALAILTARSTESAAKT